MIDFPKKYENFPTKGMFSTISQIGNCLIGGSEVQIWFKVSFYKYFFMIFMI